VISYYPKEFKHIDVMHPFIVSNLQEEEETPQIYQSRKRPEACLL
jgi:hypothetical protein